MIGRAAEVAMTMIGTPADARVTETTTTATSARDAAIGTTTVEMIGQRPQERAISP
jgi:hypothetical protein